MTSPPSSTTRSPGVGVGAVVLRGDRVLLVRRAHAPLKDRWSFPGGRVEWGERLEAALVREVREETGIEARIVEHLATVEHIEEAGASVSHHWVIVDYLCEAPEGAPRAASDAADAAWVALDQLDRYDLPTLAREVLALAVARRERGVVGGEGRT